MAGYLDDTVVKNVKDGEITISDSGGSNSMTVKLEEGDFGFTKNGPEVVPVYDRGTYDHSRRGMDGGLPEFSFSCYYTGLYATSGDDPTAFEAFFQESGASAWVTTNSTDTDLYTVDVILTIDNADNNGDEIITIDDAAIQSISFSEDMSGNKLSFSGVASSNTITITGTAPT